MSTPHADLRAKLDQVQADRLAREAADAVEAQADRDRRAYFLRHGSHAAPGEAITRPADLDPAMPALIPETLGGPTSTTAPVDGADRPRTSPATRLVDRALGAGDEGKWPASLRPAAYHGVLGQIVRAIEPHTEADPAALLLQLLVMFGNIVGRTAHFKVEADTHYLNLFAGMVGKTSKARKGVSLGRARAMFAPIDPQWVSGSITSGLSSGEGLIHHVRDAVEKLHVVKDKHGHVLDYEKVIEDHGIADKRLLVIETELASTLKVMSREGNTLSPVTRQAWDGHDLRTLTKNSSTRATAPHISLIGHITDVELRRYLDATECANGFGNRFLWVCVRRSKELPDGGGHVDLDVHVDRMRLAVLHARQVGELRRDREAGLLWHHVYGKLSAGRPGMLGAMTARAEAQAMRLACLYALGDMSSVVSPPHLKAALEVWRYCFKSAAYLFGDRLGDPTADDILAALRRVAPESMTRSEISRGLFGRNKPAMDIDRAFKLLEDCQLATHEQDRAGDGRLTERWFSVTDDINDTYDISPVSADSDVVNVVELQDDAADVDGSPPTFDMEARTPLRAQGERFLNTLHTRPPASQGSAVEPSPATPAPTPPEPCAQWETPC